MKLGDVDISKLTIDKPQKRSSYYYGLVNHNNINNLYIQVNNLKFSSFKDNTIPYIEVIIDKEFIDFLSILDKQCIQIVNENKQLWFNKDIPEDIIQEMYKNIITKIKPETIKLRLPKLNDNIICKIYDNDKIRLNIDDLQPDESFTAIVNFKGIKITKKTLSFDLCVNQIRVFRENIPRKINTDECILDTDDKFSDEYIDNIELEESFIKDKIKILFSHKYEDIELINQLNIRVKAIDDEIKQLKYKLK